MTTTPMRLLDIHGRQTMALIWSWIKATTLLGRLSARFLSVCVVISAHLAKTFVSSATDVGREGLAHCHCSNSSQRSSVGLRLGLCSAHRVPPHQTHLSMSLWTSLCEHIMLEQHRVFPKLLPHKLDVPHWLRFLHTHCIIKTTGLGLARSLK